MRCSKHRKTIWERQEGKNKKYKDNKIGEDLLERDVDGMKSDEGEQS